MNMPLSCAQTPRRTGVMCSATSSEVLLYRNAQRGEPKAEHHKRSKGEPRLLKSPSSPLSFMDILWRGTRRIPHDRAQRCVARAQR